MNHKVYDEIEELVADIIDDYELIYPLDVEELVFKLGWKLKHYNSSDEKIKLSEDGFGFFDENFYKIVIYVQEDSVLERQKFTIAHEVGHHLLIDLFEKHQIQDKQKQEKLANYFAAYILVPTPLMMYYRLIAIHEIPEFMQVSYELAKYRLDKLYKRIKYGSEELQEYEKRIIMSQNGGIEVLNRDDWAKQHLLQKHAYDEHLNTKFFNVTKENNYPIMDYYKNPIVPPKNIIPFSKIKEVKDHEKENYYVCFYCDDKEFEKVYKTPNRYRKTLSQFAGIIGFDFSLWTNLPIAEQKHRIYKNLSLSLEFAYRWSYIPNIRYGDISTRDEFLETIPPRSMVAIGTHGFIKTKEQKQKWREELFYVIQKIKPRGIVVYGPHPNDVFDSLQNLGTKFYYYEPWKPPLHRRDKNEY